MLHRWVRKGAGPRARPATAIRCRRSLLSSVLSAAMLLAALLGPGAANAQADQPYQVNEFAIRCAPGMQSRPAFGGSRVIWQERAGEVREIHGRNLATGQTFMFTTGNDYGDYDIDGDLLVTSENALGQKGIFGYRLTDFSRLVIAPLAGGSAFYRLQPRISGSVVVWAEGTNTVSAMDIYGHDLATGQTIPICTNAAQQEWPAVSGKLVVWADSRNRGASGLALYDLYGYDLAAGHEFRITARAEVIGPPAVSGSTVVWYAQRDATYRLLAYDVSKGQESELANLGSEPGTVSVDIDGDLVVWSARPAPYADHDVFGYDLALKRQFIISRAVGDQLSPRISSRAVVWTDGRHRTLNKQDENYDIYGVALTPGPAPLPAVVGAPATADTKIQIVWPHGGLPVTQASLANIGTYLLQRGTLKPAACQWHPNLQLWRAVNNGPARVVASGVQQAHAPVWEHNNADVSAARDPQNRVYLFVTVEGTSTRYNIWAHAADARTYFPQQDVPTGIVPVGSAVDAKIEIVWPHNGAPVSQARLANITANLFAPDTLNSVPPDWNPTVRLWRSLNNGVSEPVGAGVKRLVTSGGRTYPVWDFNNVDVSAARDLKNKLYFSLSVDGVQANTNVWAHGADARTYFPQQDKLDGDCS